MLNFPTQNVSDIELLKASFDVLSDPNSVTIVTDPAEVERIFQIVVDSLEIPVKASFSIANLLKIQSDDGAFYILQCLYDYRFNVDRNGLVDTRYYYRVLGLAELQQDVGDILVRPQTRGDRLVDRFFKSDIEIDNAPEFNSAYYLAARDSEVAKAFISYGMAKIMAKSKGVHLAVHKKRIFVSIEHEMKTNHTSIIESILRTVKV